MARRIAATLTLLALTGTAQSALFAHPDGECISSSTFSGNSGFRSGSFIIAGPQDVTTSLATLVTIAQDFSIQYFDTYKLVKNLKANETYALHQCGTAAPTGLDSGVKVFSIPLTSIGLDDAAAIAFAKLLGVEDRASYMSPYAVDSCMMSLGLYNVADGQSAAGCRLLTNDSSMLANVDAVFSYGNADPKYIAITASADPGVFNRLEWIKFMSTFFNKEDVANAQVASIIQSYDNATERALAAANEEPSHRPVMTWLIKFPAYPDFGLPATVQLSFAKYKQNLTQAAGATPLDATAANETAAKHGTHGVDYTFPTPFEPLTITNFTMLRGFLTDLLANVSVLVDESDWSPFGVANENVTYGTLIKQYDLDPADALQTFRFFREDGVLRTDATVNPDGYSNWFELGLVRPDIVVRELSGYVNPSLADANAAPQIIRNIEAHSPALVAAEQCPLQNCAFTRELICPLVFQDCQGRIVLATPQNRCAPTCTV